MRYYNKDGHLNHLGITLLAEEKNDIKELSFHTDHCDVCWVEVEELKNVLTDSHLRKSYYTQYLVVACSILLLSISFLFYDKNVLYPINEEYEYLINDESRSASIQIISPKELTINKDETIIFEWKNSNIINVQIEIYNYKDELVYENKSILNKFELNERFKSGHYYWKLIAQDELLILKKFTVVD